MASSRKLVVSLIGPPGSGKGSYGRHLAKALKLANIGMSDVLREMRPDLDLSSGRLVEDAIVTNCLERYLENHEADMDNRGYLLDGFPRTIRQLEHSFGTHIVVDAAIQLAVPDFVCEAKLLGRRLCPKCGHNYNVHGVDQDGWCLPPSLPKKATCSPSACNWQTRADDQPGVVHSRLQMYHQHADPIVQYFERHNRILKLKPYRGFDDVPTIIETVQKFLEKIHHGE